jgi:hypothetical protein
LPDQMGNKMFLRRINTTRLPHNTYALKKRKNYFEYSRFKTNP